MTKKSVILLSGCVTFLLLCLVSLPAAIAADRFEKYWTVEEYLTYKPHQVSKSNSFIKRVRAAAIPATNLKKPIRIAVVYPGLQASDYWRRSIVSFEKRLKELKVPYELVSHFTKPGLTVHEQSNKIGEFLSAGADYLIFTLNVSQHKPLIEKIMKGGRTKIILQNITTPLKSFKLKQPFQYVGFDHAIGTEYLVKKYLEVFGGKADYAIMYGTPGYVSEMRGGTFLRHMENHAGMALKESYYVGFNREKSYRATKDLLKNHPNIKFVFSASTDIALGVLDALQEEGRMGDIITNGWGGGSAELDAIQAGDLDFTVMRMNDDNGVAMAEAIVMDQQGNVSEVPTIFSGDMVLVEKSMTNSEIMELKNRAFRYSN